MRTPALILRTRVREQGHRSNAKPAFVWANLISICAARSPCRRAGQLYSSRPKSAVRTATISFDIFDFFLIAITSPQWIDDLVK
jgi:hypothetical protein